MSRAARHPRRHARPATATPRGQEPATAKQQTYLTALAYRTGRTFVRPTTKTEAMREIAALKKHSQ